MPARSGPALRYARAPVSAVARTNPLALIDQVKSASKFLAFVAPHTHLESCNAGGSIHSAGPPFTCGARAVGRPARAQAHAVEHHDRAENEKERRDGQLGALGVKRGLVVRVDAIAPR